MTIPRRAAEAAMKKDDAPRSQPLTPANDNDADPRAAKVDAALTRIAEAIGRHIAREHIRARKAAHDNEAAPENTKTPQHCTSGISAGHCLIRLGGLH